MAETINLNYGNFDLGMDFDPLSDSDNDSLLTIDLGDVLVNSLEKNCAEMITSDVKSDLQDSENVQNEVENKPQQKRFKAMTDSDIIHTMGCEFISRYVFIEILFTN